MADRRVSAGLLMYRLRDGRLEVLLVHPGGPWWRGKDLGAWSIPKGKIEKDENPLDAACREFKEETGLTPTGPFHELGTVRQKSGKRVHAWAFEGDADPAGFKSNTFEEEWPPRSGRMQTFHEIDAAEFFDIPTARAKINPGQVPLLDELEELQNTR